LVSAGAIKISPPTKDEPSTKFSGDFWCKAALTAVGAGIFDWLGGIATFLSLSWLESTLQNIIGNRILDMEVTPTPISLGNAGIPVNWRSAVCDGSALGLNGVLYGGVNDPEPFKPRVDIIVTKRTDLTLTSPETSGNATTDNLTGTICPVPDGTTLHYFRDYRDRQITIAIDPHDVPLPIFIREWTVQFAYTYPKYSTEYIEYDPTIYPLVRGDLDVITTV